MKKASLREGMDEFFPPTHYISVMRKLIAGGRLRFTDLKGEHNEKSHGLKLQRMIKQGLIEKVARGEYEITDYGRKIMRAVDAFKKEMAE